MKNTSRMKKMVSLGLEIPGWWLNPLVSLSLMFHFLLVATEFQLIFTEFFYFSGVLMLTIDEAFNFNSLSSIIRVLFTD